MKNITVSLSDLQQMEKQVVIDDSYKDEFIKLSWENEQLKKENEQLKEALIKQSKRVYHWGYDAAKDLWLEE